MTTQAMLFAGDWWPGSTEGGLVLGFRESGWDTRTLDRRRYFLVSRSLALRALARLTNRFSRVAYNAAIIKAAKDNPPKAFFTVKGVDIFPETLRTLRALGIVTVNYYPDVAFEHAGLSGPSLGEYDLFFSTKSFHIANERDTPVRGHLEMLHHGYVSNVHYPHLADLDERAYAVDCCYVGCWSPNKQDVLMNLVSLIPDVDLKILGPGWQQRARGTLLERHIANEVVYGDDYARAIQTARINLAFHYGRAGSQGWQDLVSTRTFEIPACKGFMLHIDNPEVRSLFDCGSEIDCFSSPEELAQKVKFYLARSELRRACIERAYARCVPAYSYEARAAVMSRALDERLAKAG